VTADNAVANPCATLEQDPTCGFLRSKCVNGARGASGECYVFTEVYDCGYTANIPTTTVAATE
jgi:conjugal transfer mating pair stabilization protein TraN